MYIYPLSIIFVLWLILFYVPLSFSMFPPSLSTLQTFELADISHGQWFAAAGCYALGIGTVLLMVVVGHLRDGEVTTPFTSSPKFTSAQHSGQAPSFLQAVGAVFTERFGSGFAPVLRRAAGLVLTAFFLGLAGIILFQEPPLPKVVVTKESSTPSHREEVQGLLLVHTEGFWHIMKDRGKHRGAMIAIPDDNATAVRIPAKFE